MNGWSHSIKFLLKQIVPGQTHMPSYLSVTSVASGMKRTWEQAIHSGLEFLSLTVQPTFSTSDRSYTSGLNSSAVEQTHSMVAGIFHAPFLASVTPSLPGIAASGQRSRYCFAVGRCCSTALSEAHPRSRPAGPANLTPSTGQH